ncbi:zinc finger protein 474-like [Daktulosphaira vitifoliae]|uniref:zinc finger protein 474-like n=1 Tax=Daktulosphaira vitifoliae TaxID=58002 RepID=UPI0021A9C110|nr:zinc finger protein 474-like [Daktulosphaira vitifoliae]XP_050539014.1 zinc finger protein 474-like [Daktulosphaira vitifoliae]
MEKSTETTNTMKPKKFPSILKKMMISRLKSISKDANSAVKAPTKKVSTNNKPQLTSPLIASTKHESVKKIERPSTAVLDKPLVLNKLIELDKPLELESNLQPPVIRRTNVIKQQQLNNRTYRIKTKDRKSVLSLPEVQAKVQQAAKKKSNLPVKVKSSTVKKQAPQPPPRAQPISVPTQDEAEYQLDKWTPMTVGSARRKRLVLCYLCGKEFGTASLPFHEPQCLKKWIVENSQLPEHLQRAIPQKPKENQIGSSDDWNRLAWETTQSNLVPCNFCQRKFLANRLDAHTRVCIEAKKKYMSPTLNISSAMDKKPKKKPQPCYVCGRLFGSASIGIHEPQCLIKWIRENDNLPSHLRRPVPIKPEVVVNSETGSVDQEATREEYWKTYLSQLVPCDRCQRTFDPNRLEVHQRSCKGSTIK